MYWGFLPSDMILGRWWARKSNFKLHILKSQFAVNNGAMLYHVLDNLTEFFLHEIFSPASCKAS